MSTTFESHLRNSLTDFDIDLPHPLWALISWLEERGHRHETVGGMPWLSMFTSHGKSELWSHVCFEPPPDLVRFWFSRDGLEKQVIPFVHCGGDGSHIALWRHPGAVDRYVFLGSEGEAFTVAERVEDLIVILTMGYTSIEGRDDLMVTPELNWEHQRDGDWPEPVDIMSWVSEHYGLLYPATGGSLLPYDHDGDPFAAFVAAESG